MLFNSFSFIFVFLPIVLIVFFQIGNSGHHRAALIWLVGASLFFYGWWNPVYLGLIIGSIFFNYKLGAILSSLTQPNTGYKKGILTFGIAGNLGLLGYFKYCNFFVENINALLGTDLFFSEVVLPLAISFFTFQQITYLVDTYRGTTREHNFLHYCLFVTFFPQLIAGPIVHHREMLPQFAKGSIYRFNQENFSVGFTIFLIGLFKKVVLADGIAPWATEVFQAAESGNVITFFEAWGGTLAFSFQLYFDFSGYSDMAIGLARIFGIILPLNFNSPYKATSIIDFWRRWHMSLSRFFRDYVYIPLGGNRQSSSRCLFNIFITMLLGGLWHGASWTFVIWGGLHGVYLIINHIWREVRKAIGFEVKNSWWSVAFARGITFLAVLVGWVFFRAETTNSVIEIIKGMVGANGFYLSYSWFEKLGLLGPILQNLGIRFTPMELKFGIGMVLWLIALLAITLLFPNTQQIMGKYNPAFEVLRREIQPVSRRLFQWQPNLVWASISCVIMLYCLLNLGGVSEFLYFQF